MQGAGFSVEPVAYMSILIGVHTYTCIYTCTNIAMEVLNVDMVT